MKFDARLIHAPNAQPPIPRTLWSMVTAACWVFYAYLLTPLLTLVLWAFGFQTTYFELYQREHAVDPFLLIALPLLAIGCAVLLIGWAEYSRWRFASHKERRSASPNVPLSKIAEGLGATGLLAQRLAAAKNVILHMDDEARPRSITRVLPAPPPSIDRNGMPNLAVSTHHKTLYG